MFEEIHDVKKLPKPDVICLNLMKQKKTWASKDAYIKIIFHRFL